MNRFLSLTYVAFFATISAYAQPLTTADVQSRGMDPENFLGDLYATYLRDGEEAAVNYIEGKADGGLDLTGLRNAVLAANENKPAIAEVEIHPENQKMIPFFNSQLRRMGIDFVEIVPKYNDKLTHPLKPFKEDAEAYSRWEKARKFWVPTISVLATMIPVTIWKMSFGSHIHYADVVAGVFQAIAIRKIEIMTSIYSSPLDKYLWSPERFQRPAEDTPEMGLIRRKMNQMLRGVSDVLNKHIVDRTGNFIKAGYIYNYSFNYVYAFAIYSIGGVVALANNWIHAYNVGHGFDTFTSFYEYKGLGKFLLQNFLGTMGFYFAFGVNQTLIGVLKARGVISEFQRLKIELTSLYFAKPGRILTGTNEGFWPGVIMTSIVGAIVTIPTIVKLVRTNPRANRIKAAFERNAEFATRLRSGKVDVNELRAIENEFERSPDEEPTRNLIERATYALGTLKTKIVSCAAKLNWLAGAGRPTY